MQLPATDELVLISGLAPIRAAKLRYFEDRNFTSRVMPAPVLAEVGYADRPRPRSNDWGRFARLPDARLSRADDDAGSDDDGGMQQQRHPGLVEDAGAHVAEVNPAIDATVDDDDAVAADQRAMDRARLSVATRSYAINEGAERDLIPGL